MPKWNLKFSDIQKVLRCQIDTSKNREEGMAMSKTEKDLIVIDEQAQVPSVAVSQCDIKGMIYIVRNQ